MQSSVERELRLSGDWKEKREDSSLVPVPIYFYFTLAIAIPRKQRVEIKVAPAKSRY